MCERKANITGPQSFIDPGYMQSIILKDLRLSTTYFYRVGTNEHDWSSVYSFTNRPVGNKIAYDDMGVAPLGQGVRSAVARVPTGITSKSVTNSCSSTLLYDWYWKS
jgi:hypothetical protein